MDKKEKYYVFDWDEKELYDFNTKEEAERYLIDTWDEGEVDLEDIFTVIKGIRLEIKNPERTDIIQD